MLCTQYLQCMNFLTHIIIKHVFVSKIALRHFHHVSYSMMQHFRSGPTEPGRRAEHSVSGLPGADVWGGVSRGQEGCPSTDEWRVGRRMGQTAGGQCHLYLYKYENVCLSVCVCLCVHFFLGHFETVWDTFGTKFLFTPGEVLTQTYFWLKPSLIT